MKSAKSGNHMRLLGAHMSIAGGLENAVTAATQLGMTTFQIFTHSPSKWSVEANPKGTPSGSPQSRWIGKPLTSSQIDEFVSAKKEGGFTFAVAHDSYLINLGSANPDLWDRSIAAFISELEKAEALGLNGVVTHPGASGEDTPEKAIERVAKALDIIHKSTKGFQVKTLIETTAGQGTSLGWKFEQIGSIVAQVKTQERIGVCLDTCHMFAAGYAYEPQTELNSTVKLMDEQFGIDRIAVIHTNDSQKGLGSKVDRHAHIGKGQIGLNGIKAIVTHPKLKHLPLVLETPKEEDETGRPMDEVNLEILKSFSSPKKS